MHLCGDEDLKVPQNLNAAITYFYQGASLGKQRSLEFIFDVFKHVAYGEALVSGGQEIMINLSVSGKDNLYRHLIRVLKKLEAFIRENISMQKINTIDGVKKSMHEDIKNFFVNHGEYLSLHSSPESDDVIDASQSSSSLFNSAM